MRETGRKPIQQQHTTLTRGRGPAKLTTSAPKLPELTLYNTTMNFGAAALASTPSPRLHSNQGDGSIAQATRANTKKIHGAPRSYRSDLQPKQRTR